MFNPGHLSYLVNFWLYMYRQWHRATKWGQKREEEQWCRHGPWITGTQACSSLQWGSTVGHILACGISSAEITNHSCCCQWNQCKKTNHADHDLMFEGCLKVYSLSCNLEKYASSSSFAKCFLTWILEIEENLNHHW